ncbi:MAG: dihydropteroate synthase [Nitrospirae bacterium]|nr:dihydropteroate synthase [Nitrospirota bacterium]
MLIVAERINSSRKRIANAISERDASFIQTEALVQAKAGSDYIDVNAGSFRDEAECLKWLVDVVQDVTDIPLCLDSANPDALSRVIPVVKKPPMINSINLKPSRLEPILPLVVDYKAKVIALCESESIMAATTDAKIDIAAGLVEKVTARGIPLDDLYIDPLIFPLATNSRSALASLEAIERIRKEFPGVHTICGLTNVSHGLPNRKLVNRTFLITALARGLDSAILDPSDKELYSALKAALIILGQDEYCLEYIHAYREGRLG